MKFADKKTEKVAIACDHGGYALKTQIAEYLHGCGFATVDYGTNSDQSCDYPDFARPAAQSVAKGECAWGIVVCTTGIGVSMVANKVRGVRCALCVNADMAHMTRAHNNANMLALGQKYVDFAAARDIINEFVTTEFEGGKHERRVNKIEE